MKSVIFTNIYVRIYNKGSLSNYCNELPHHDAQELVNIDLALPGLVRHPDHLLDLLLRDADPELAEHLAQVLTTNAAITISVHHCKGFPQLLGLVLVIGFPGVTSNCPPRRKNEC